MTHWNNLSQAEIRTRLAATGNSKPQNPYPINYFNRPLRRAGVLIPFTRIDSAWHLVFIRRTQHETDHHSGQVAFPGGGQDEGDSTIVATALREAQEEVGLNPQDVTILGRLNDVISITNYHVTPVVGAFSSPYPFTQDTVEVDRIFSIPLAWLASPGRHQVHYRKVDGHDPWPVVYFNEYDGELLWGFTAALTLRLVEILAPA